MQDEGSRNLPARRHVHYSSSILRDDSEWEDGRMPVTYTRHPVHGEWGQAPLSLGRRTPLQLLDDLIADCGADLPKEDEEAA